MVENNNIVDINISQHKTFRIDGDNDRRLSLDISDMNVITRLEEAYPRMREAAMNAADKVAQLKDIPEDAEDSSAFAEMAEVLKDIDADMRKEIDYVFDSNVSEMCAPKGTLYDPYNGEFRFEHIIDVITQLYANNLASEFKTMQDKVKKHTDKYTKTSSKRKK